MIPIAMISTPREELTLDQSINNLRCGGFAQPVTVFAEPGRKLLEPAADVTVIENPTKLGAFANWLQALKHLAAQAEDYVMLVEDDVIYSKIAAICLRRLLISNMQPRMVSLYTSPRNGHDVERLAEAAFPFGQMGGWRRLDTVKAYGALALCFSRGKLPSLISQLEGNPPDAMTGKMDIIAYKKFKDDTWFHCPSLAEHTDPTRTTIPRGTDMPSPKNHRFRKAYKFENV